MQNEKEEWICRLGKREAINPAAWTGERPSHDVWWARLCWRSVLGCYSLDGGPDKTDAVSETRFRTKKL